MNSVHYKKMFFTVTNITTVTNALFIGILKWQ
jgi:hypothetical protein